MSRTHRKSPILKPGLSDNARWAATAARDKSFDGAFVIAVATTGIYCRPGCPARLPKRENVEFFETCASAEAAGFRACKRCKPLETSRDAHYAAMITKACKLIETSDVEPKLADLARLAGLSPFHFHRIFRSITGVTTKAYAVAHRQKRVRVNLKNAASVTEAIYGSGFNSSGRFYASSSKVLGMTPKTFRNGGAGADIRFAVGECSLGAILVAASAKGITAIFLGDDPDHLARELQDRFPKANFIGGDKTFERLVAKVIAFVEAPQAKFDLPLDVQGTAFQHRVWIALQNIPPGSTASYADIAKRLGEPKAARAVAGACAANKVAVVIPCHRVVRTDGALSGYRWGVKRKRALLNREAKD